MTLLNDHASRNFGTPLESNTADRTRPLVVYDLRSDTVTLPSEAMKRAMVDAPLGDDVLGDDPTVKRLERVIAERTGKESGLFFPSGTQANQVAVNLHTSPGCEILVESASHVYNYEAGGPAALSGVQVHPIETPDGILRADRLARALRPRDAHFAQTRLVCLENTHNGHGGRVYPIEPMEEVSGWARKAGLRLHLDGARLFNAVIASGIPVERYAACADTVSICLSKGLGAPVGTCLVGDRDAIRQARWIRKRWGGGMRQAGVLAAAGLYALEHNVDRLGVDHEVARRIGAGLAGIEGLELDTGSIETNIVIIGVNSAKYDAPALARALEVHGVRVLALGPTKIRAVTHLDVPNDAAEAVPERVASAVDVLVTGG